MICSDETSHAINHLKKESNTSASVITTQQGEEPATEQKCEGAVTEPQCTDVSVRSNEVMEAAAELPREAAGTEPINEPNEANDNFTEAEMHQIEELHEPFLLFNDNGNLQRVSELFLAALYMNHRKIVFLPQENRFYPYNPDTGKWEAISLEILERDLTDFTSKYVKTMGITAAYPKLGHPMMTKVIAVLKSRVSDEKFFETPEVDAIHWFHYVNCMVEFNMQTKSWDEKPFSPKYRSRECFPVKYDPQAVARRFITELIDQAMNEEDKALLQQYMGQCLLGRNSSQKILVMTGTPNGGKGTLISLIRKMIGPQYCAELRLNQSDRRFETSHYVGKTLLIGSDVDSDFLSRPSSERLKAYVGGDLLNYEFKCSPQFGEMNGEFNVIITSNHTLQIRSENDWEAWARRMLWIRYQNRPPEKNVEHFEDVLIREEASGIANWMLEGTARVIQNNGQIEVQPAQKERIQSLLDDQVGHIKTFVQDYITESEGADVTDKELWTRYNVVRIDRDFPSMKRKDFTRSIKDEFDLRFKRLPRNDISRPKGKQRGYKGLQISYSA